MNWFGGLLGIRAEGELPVTDPSGVKGHILGNPHGHPDTVLVTHSGRVDCWPLREVTAMSPRSTAWLAGYADGFIVDPDDSWPLVDPSKIADPYGLLERSWEGMRHGSGWIDPDAAQVRLVDRASPFIGMPYVDYLNAPLVSRFLLASTPAWWRHLGWHQAEDLMARAYPEDADEESENVDTIVVSQALLLAMSYTAVRDNHAARGVLATLEGRLGLDGQEHEFVEPASYPSGMAVIGDDDFVLEGDVVHVGALRRSPAHNRLVVNGIGSIRLQVVLPYGALSVWWLRGYLAGREPTLTQVGEVFGERAKSLAVWRMIVFLHHLRRDGALSADLDDVERLLAIES